MKWTAVINQMLHLGKAPSHTRKIQFCLVVPAASR